MKKNRHYPEKRGGKAAQHPKGQPLSASKVPQLILWLHALASLVLLPLFYYRPAVDLTLVPKLMVLAILLLVVVLFYLFFGKGDFRPGEMIRLWPAKLWAGFVLVTIVSLFVAINPKEGMFDVLKAVFVLIYLVVTAALIPRSGNIRPFAVAALLMSLILALTALGQYFSHAFRQTDLDALYQIRGLYSHKNVVSLMLFLALPLLTYAFLTSRLHWRLLIGISVFLNVMVVVLAQTRSVWLAMIAFVLVSAFFAAYHRKSVFSGSELHLKSRLYVIGLILVLAIASAIFINNYSISNPQYKPQQTVAHEEYPVEQVEKIHKRVGSVFDTSSPNRVKRLAIWASTLQMFADHPVLGTGAGNWKIHAPNYFQPDPSEWYYHNWRRPHNDFLWALAEKGIPGMLLYLGFFVSLLVMAWKLLLKKIPVQRKILVILMMAGIAGFCVDGLFAFPYERVDVLTYMMFYAAVLMAVSKQTTRGETVTSRESPKSTLYIMIVLLGVGIFLTQQMIRSEVYTKHAHHALLSGHWEDVVAAIDKGNNRVASLTPTNNALDWYRGNANMQMERYREAIDDFKHALEQNPFSVPAINDLASVYFMIEDYERAAELFKEGIRLYPRNQTALRGLGMIYVQQGRYREALDLYYYSKTDQYEPQLEALIQQAHQLKWGPGD